MERIDKIIASQTNYSRKDVKKLISQKKVKVNDEIVKRPEQKFDEQQDTIYIDENKLEKSFKLIAKFLNCEDFLINYVRRNSDE